MSEEKKTLNEESQVECASDEDNMKHDCEKSKEEKGEADNIEAEVDNQEEKQNSQKKDEEDCDKRYMRLSADFANYKKRSEKEKSEIYKSANARLITNLLPVIDDFDRALKHAEESGKDAMVDGLKLILKGFMETLHKEGLEEINTEDADFDPNLHHAVMTEEVDGMEADKVIMELQRGYKVNGKVARPSVVKVSK